MGTDCGPSGAETVIEWLALVHASKCEDPALWRMLDDPLRLALTQGWVLHNGGDTDDDLAEALADEDSNGPQFESMINALIQHWQHVYAALREEIGILQQSHIVGVDMELIVLTGPEYIGEVQAGSVSAHCFVVRYEDEEWRIAALARRLPVPGWPPREEVIPGLSIDG